MHHQLSKLAKEHIESIHALIDKAAGPFERELERRLKLTGASRNVYHGGSFTGKSCMLILKKRDKFWGFLGTKQAISCIDQKQVDINENAI